MTPAILEIEQSLLGGLLSAPSFLALCGHLSAGHFFEPIHGRIFDTIKTHDLRDSALAEEALKDEFARDQALAEIGGAQYILGLRERAPILSAQVKDYVELVISQAQKRALRQAAEDIIRRIDDAPLLGDPVDLAAEMQAELERIQSSAALGWRHAADRYLDMIDRAERGEDRGWSYGLPRLDDMTGGIRPGSLIVIAARPSIGKTLVGLNVARALSQQGVAVGYVSLEMAERELLQRLATDLHYREQYSAQYLAYSAMQRGTLKPDQYALLREQHSVLRALPLYIDDRGGQTIGQIRASVRALFGRIKRAGGTPGAVVIDHLHIIASETKNRHTTRTLEIAEITGALKAVAKQAGIAVILLAQLNRGAEGREDRRPTLSDARDSGAIEQDADVFLGLYRKSYYLERKADLSDAEEEELRLCRNELEIGILKNRQGGSTGLVQCKVNLPSASVRT